MNSELTNHEFTSHGMRKSLAIFSFTCCEGCQFELLSFYDHFKQLLKFYDVKNFRLGTEENFPGPFDVALIEGSVESEEQIKLIKKIRKESGTIIAIGACAHMGGIQSERNSIPRNIIAKNTVKTVPEIIKTDFVVPGCPVSHTELIKCLLSVYWDQEFILPDLAVCFECRQNGNKCLLKNDKPCLGPITRGGCNSVCINSGEACLGCRGPLEQANINKMKDMLEPLLSPEEIKNWLTIYGDLEQEYKKLTR